ncbi:Plant intracellular Ras-group-related LRR protein 3 [Choanephora cucurbitarum]|uniref:Plant intracellular Ras-group-related LRR protein 3 n=1 Tax=Choanephora cucurbitarum TaxID=101091 RepID=A0A1C7NFG2_9FUNG|nr:Plant intracellular Ras-group-related LRR protein 3 [Choanephora cucurbitarum]
MSYLNGGKNLEGVNFVQLSNVFVPENSVISSDVPQGSTPSSIVSVSSNEWINENTLILRRMQLSSEDLFQRLKSEPEKHRVLSLDASRNRISRVPTELYKFKSITNLVLSNNCLDHIPSALYCSLRQLKQLNVSENAIEDIPKEMPLYLDELTILKANNNLIQRLPDSISKWEKLCDFQLGSEYGGNLVQTLPIAVSAMKDLVSLDLSFNRLDILLPNTFTGLFQLQYLNLSHNQITDIPRTSMFRDCKALMTLDLSNNQISYLPGPVVSDCLYLIRQHQLQLLNLNNNRITILPAELLNQEHGAHIMVNRNPIVQDHSLLNQPDTAEHPRASNVFQTLRPILQPSSIFDTYDFAMALQEEQVSRNHSAESGQQLVYQSESQNLEHNINDDMSGVIDKISETPSVLLLSLHEITLRTLLISDNYKSLFFAIPKHIQEEVHLKKQSCFHCGKPFVNEWVNSVLLRKYFSASFTTQQVRFCSNTCWYDYHISMSQRAIYLEQQSNQIRTRVLGTALEPGSIEWIEAAVTAASLQEEQLNILVNQMQL